MGAAEQDGHPSPNWFEWKPVGPFAEPVPCAPGEGYARALDYARDHIARPHDRSTGEKLWAECHEVATLLARIATDEGDTSFVAHALRVMILDAVDREGATPDAS
jgi:hypothetical protein